MSETTTKTLQHRYSLMIADLEHTMQQSWEEKAKLSAQYEEERLRMVRALSMLCS